MKRRCDGASCNRSVRVGGNTNFRSKTVNILELAQNHFTAHTALTTMGYQMPPELDRVGLAVIKHGDTL